MKQIFLKAGKPIVEEIPEPMLDIGCALVDVSYSCISIGTETSGIQSATEPLWRKAIKNPEKVKTALKMVKNHGLDHTKEAIKQRTSKNVPIGYSAAGVIRELSTEISEFAVGQRVACTGAQCAHHAETICVPRNLIVPIPINVSMQLGSTVALGGIALQGVRRAQPTLGEVFAVIGLGMIGQLCCQMLKANGCRVVGIDINQARVEIAKEFGLDCAIPIHEDNVIDLVMKYTQGIGADGVIITAASQDSSIVSSAFNMCRRKGRVILVGDVGLNISRSDIYEKELDFFISTSYGPGRYDSNYEEKGLDYPIAYVRWTEGRNMSEYLRLISEKRLHVDKLVSDIINIDDANSAYEALSNQQNKPLSLLIAYPNSSNNKDSKDIISIKSVTKSIAGKVQIGFVGAGGFANSVHLPNLKKMTNHVEIRTIVSKKGYNAKSVGIQFGAQHATTSAINVYNDKDIDAVFICTRHNLHAQAVIEALSAGKHVFVEKPLTTTIDDLNRIKSFFTNNSNTPILLTGFNRRFSKFILLIKDYIANRMGPMIINYQMNAGFIPENHWVHSEEGGGRNIGEACHIYDLFIFLTDSHPLNIDAYSIIPQNKFYRKDDNFCTIIRFNDGSVATLTYTSLGNALYPKESMQIYVDGMIISLKDYQTLQFYGKSIKNIKSRFVDKGHMKEVSDFIQAVRNNGPCPIPLEQQFLAMDICFKVENFLRR